MVKRKPRPYEECHKYLNGEEYKLCSDCNEWIPMNIDNFYRNKSAPDDFNPNCKECARKKSLQYRNDNIEKARSTTYEHYQKNKESYDDRRTKWMQENKVHQRDYYKGYQKENSDYLNQYAAERRLHKTHAISNKEWEMCLEYFNFCCAYCEMPEEIAIEMFNRKLHREHVDHDGANDLSNAIPACTRCNSSKWAHPMEEWYRKRSFFKEENLDKIKQWLYVDYKIYIYSL